MDNVVEDLVVGVIGVEEDVVSIVNVLFLIIIS